MKVKVLLLTKDLDYTERLNARVMQQYYNRIQLSSFSDLEMAKNSAKEIRPDVFVMDEGFYPVELELPMRCTLAILGTDKRFKSIQDVPVIQKYQRVAGFVRDCTDVFMEQASKAGIQLENYTSNQKNIVTFFPGTGGVGASTLAAAYAISLASRGERVLYLNLEELGVADLYFSGDANNNLSKVMYALQLDNSSTAMKLENALNQDRTGVWFYSGSVSALDMQDLNSDSMEILFEQLGRIDLFEYIVVDMQFSISNMVFAQIERSDSVVFVSDGSVTANSKLRRISDALEIQYSQNSNLLSGHLFVMYNRFSSKRSKKIENTVFTEVGGIGRIENASIVDLLDIISKNESFQNFLQ